MSKRPSTSETIFDKYDNWKHFFREKLATSALFEYQSWNHEIKFILEKQLTFEFIYALSNKKLEVFCKYLKINKKKIFLRKSKFLTEYSILFIFKKNEKFRLCVDYRKLNKITIDIHYSILKSFKIDWQILNVLSNWICAKHTISYE